MARTEPLEFLNLALSGRALSESDLRAFLAANPKEKVHFEYKSGLVIQKTDAANMVRKYTTGFANSDGGVLFVGVRDEKPKSIDGCHRVGVQPLDEWAKDCLVNIIGQFSPPPKPLVVTTSDGEVLLVAVARCPRLIPTIESNKTVYYLRSVDSTIEVPPYLLTDLLLGRRQAPVLRPVASEIIIQSKDYPIGGTSHEVLSIRLKLEIENIGLPTARSLDAGIVAWTVRNPPLLANDSILPFVRAENPGSFGTGLGRLDLQLSRLSAQTPWGDRAGDQTVRSFRSQEFLFDPIVVPYIDGTLNAALYLLPDGCPPQWFHLSLEYGTRDVGGDRGAGRVLISESHEAPVIGWASR